MKAFKRIAICFMVLVMCGLAFGIGYFTNSLTKGNEYADLVWLVKTIDKNYCVFDEETGEYTEYTQEDYLRLISDNFLDQYSSYLSPDELVQMNVEAQGDLYGSGLFVYREDKMRVHSVAFNSPLERACDEVGLNPARMLIAGVSDVDKEMTAVSTYEEYSALVGVYGEAQPYKLYFTDGETVYSVTVEKQAFVSSYVKYRDNKTSFEFISEYGQQPVGTASTHPNTSLPDGVALIEFTQFNGAAAEEMKDALNYAKTQGISKIILDLRENGGGYLDICKNIASLFIDGQNDVLIGKAIYKDGSQELFYTNHNSFPYAGDFKLTVIANEHTASASEVLIGALSDYGKINIDENLVVTNDNYSGGINYTYGKGIMQSTFVSPRLSAVTLTSAYIYWPVTGRTIHGKGVPATELNSTAYSNGLIRALEILN